MGDLYKRTEAGGDTVALVHAIALLIECLDNRIGLVSFEEYQRKLMALWEQIPADDTSGAGAVFQKLSEIITDAIAKRLPPPGSHTSLYASGQ